jgi:hypothetical protein
MGDIAKVQDNINPLTAGTGSVSDGQYAIPTYRPLPKTLNTSAAIDEIIPALAAAKVEFPIIEKSDKNLGYPNAKFANFATIKKVIDPILAKHGLFVLQTANPHEEIIGSIINTIETQIWHKSGQFLAYTMHVPFFSMKAANPIDKFGKPTVPKPTDAHGIASHITYFLRYAYTSFLGIASDEADDDGNRAMNAIHGRNNWQQNPHYPTQQQPPYTPPPQQPAQPQGQGQQPPYTPQPENMSPPERATADFYQTAAQAAEKAVAQPPVNPVTPEEIGELEGDTRKCREAFQANVKTHLQKEGFKSITNLPRDRFDALRLSTTQELNTILSITRGNVIKLTDLAKKHKLSPKFLAKYAKMDLSPTSFAEFPPDRVDFLLTSIDDWKQYKPISGKKLTELTGKLADLQISKMDFVKQLQDSDKLDISNLEEIPSCLVDNIMKRLDA